MGNRWIPDKAKAYPVLKAVDLTEDLWGRKEEYSKSILCPHCNQELNFCESKFAWPLTDEEGHHWEMYGGGIPGYECEACEAVYLLRRDLDALKLCIEEEFQKFRRSIEVVRPDWLVPIN
jgi:hypothetical protein